MSCQTRQISYMLRHLEQHPREANGPITSADRGESHTPPSDTSEEGRSCAEISQGRKNRTLSEKKEPLTTEDKIDTMRVSSSPSDEKDRSLTETLDVS